ncbi:hypothetical protein FDB40_07340 [Clostridium botulinum]|nr:hypothetical protein [Clostridium botulinum]
MKKSLFSSKINIKKEKSNFIDDKKLDQIKNDVNLLLEIKKCKICKQNKIIYYFKIDENRDEYSDICIECNLEYKEKACKICEETKEIIDFYTVSDRGYTDICKKCIQETVKNNTHTKVCVGCKKELQAIPKYFKIAGHYSGYLENKCRICRGLKYLK